jgi:hypothetical protein
LAVCLLLALGCAARAGDKSRKIDPIGTWKWTLPVPVGQPHEFSLTLKLEAGKLTGTISGRRADRPINDLRLQGDEISFRVIREFDGNMMTNQYSGKISGDTIKGKMEFTRIGEKQSRDWEARREATQPKGEAGPAK